MQVFGLPGHLIRSARSASRSTLHRWRKRAAPLNRRPHRLRGPNRPAGAQAAVERLRLDFPMWGKAKIGPLVRELGFAVSDATVGRILGDLIRRGRVPAAPDLLRKLGPRSAAKKRPYAVRKPETVAFQKPGDVVQIDPLSISILPGQAIKQFTAYDPFAKWTVARPYKRATAKNAAEFLDRVRAQMPDPVRAIQIDGGSEFMAVPGPVLGIEQACADAKIPLYLLPPRSPKLNGAVERCNGAWRYEFYACSDLPLDINKNRRTRRRLPKSLQQPQTPRRPCRNDPGKVPLNPPRQPNPAVSYVLSQDTHLTRSSTFLYTECRTRRPPQRAAFLFSPLTLRSREADFLRHRKELDR